MSVYLFISDPTYCSQDDYDSQLCTVWSEVTINLAQT